jgi:hypothetical protein
MFAWLEAAVVAVVHPMAQAAARELLEVLRPLEPYLRRGAPVSVTPLPVVVEVVAAAAMSILRADKVAEALKEAAAALWEAWAAHPHLVEIPVEEQKVTPVRVRPQIQEEAAAVLVLRPRVGVALAAVLAVTAKS